MLIEKNKNLIDEGLEERCDSYLKFSTFHIWIKGDQLVFLPIFLQIDFACHKEYFFQFGNAQSH